MGRGELAYRATRPLAVAIAVILVLVSGALLLLAGSMRPGAPTIFLSSLSGLLFTLAAGSILYEVALRETVFRETVQMLDLKQSVVSTGLTMLGAEAEIDWREFFSDSTTYRLQVASPFGWLEQIWPHILDAGARRRIDVEIYLPNSSGGSIGPLASRFGRDTAEFRAQLDSFVSTLQLSWRNAEVGHQPLFEGSHLALRNYEQFPASELAMTDSNVMVRWAGCLEVTPGAPVLCVEFKHGSGAFPVTWIKAQLDDMARLPSLWDRRVSH